ncbi:RNA polymerase sigma factor [Gayadomonas joobiniege]|uniref:RNA polymerase sigma factor n=1 Tax=Gayadomonas joobiniege TaxID=1234606 RepID=UPI000369CE39|nr:sigma-70 family RNA polymerase sigma factor [Gayadomonas joobiniege]
MSKKKNRLKDLYQNYWADLSKLFRHKLSGSGFDYEDAIQNAFIKFSELDQKTQVVNPKAYLYQLTKNDYIDYHRRQKLEAAFIDSQLSTPHEGHHSPEDCLSTQQQIDLLEASVESLSEQQKTILVMHRIDGKTYAEIAQHLGCSIAHVCRQLNQSLVILAANMQASGGNNES